MDNVPIRMILAVGGLVLLAAVVGGSVLFSIREKPLEVRKVASRGFAFLWLLPALVVMWLVLSRGTISVQSRSLVVQQGKPTVVLESASGDRETTVLRNGEVATVSAVKNSKPIAAVDTRMPDWVSKPETWVSEPESKTGTSRRIVLSSKQYATVEEAEIEVIIMATKKIRDDIVANFGYQGSPGIPADLVRKHALKQRYVETINRVSGGNEFTVYRVHRQLEFSPQGRTVFAALWRDQLVAERLWVFGSWIALATLALATTTAYFRLDAGTGGAYRRRLKLAAVSLVVAGGLVALKTV